MVNKMKQLVCEICGSTDLIKREGVFVCQACGCKYSIEEAKKIMIDGTVEVVGKVEIDNEKTLSNYIKLIEEEINGKNFQAALDYIAKALVMNPDAYELWLQKARTVGEDFTVQKQNFHAAIVAAKKAIDKAPIEKKKEVSLIAAHAITNQMERAIKEIYKEIVAPHVMSPSTISSATMKAAEYVHPICLEWIHIFEFPELSLNEKRELLEIYTNLATSGGTNGIKGVIDWGETFQNNKKSYRFAMEENIQKIHPEYAITSEEEKSGCYIATAVYGTYDCPQVWTLRRFRDYTLARNWYGRLFIHVYYTVSPVLVKKFGYTDWFKKLWRGKLDCIVDKLQSVGVESTQYEDKSW